MTGALSYVTIDSPIGWLTLTAGEGAVTNVDWGRGRVARSNCLLAKAARQIGEYFEGSRKEFNLPLSPAGSEFQKSVWDIIREIPFGETCTYGGIAHRLGVTPQAVGQACGLNPIPIIIPCHRVLSAAGLGGFSGQGGVETKVSLLKLEGAASLLI